MVTCRHLWQHQNMKDSTPADKDGSAAPGAIGAPNPNMAGVAAAIGDPTRAAMLLGLMGGPPMSAGQLAAAGHVGAATASTHLRRLLNAGLVQVARHGRQRHYALAGPAVASALEALGRLAPPTPVRSLAASSQARALRQARTCYDHLAGRLGVWLLDTLLADEWLVPADPDSLAVTQAGAAGLRNCGVPWPPAAPMRRRLAFACSDWSEERPHLAGALGAAVTTHLLTQGWLARVPGQRTVTLTDVGHEALTGLFPARWPPELDASQV